MFLCSSNNNEGHLTIPDTETWQKFFCGYLRGNKNIKSMHFKTFLQQIQLFLLASLNVMKWLHSKKKKFHKRDSLEINGFRKQYSLYINFCWYCWIHGYISEHVFSFFGNQTLKRIKSEGVGERLEHYHREMHISTVFCILVWYFQKFHDAQNKLQLFKLQVQAYQELMKSLWWAGMGSLESKMFLVRFWQ